MIAFVILATVFYVEGALLSALSTASTYKRIDRYAVFGITFWGVLWFAMPPVVAYRLWRKRKRAA